jgi:DNA-binding transcriptional LysR family regulator
VQGTLARHFLMPALPAFIAQYPDIELLIGEDDRLVDLVREGVDCVLRAGTLHDSSMVGRRVALMEQVSVASPSYLAQFGEPDSLEALNGHRAVNYVSSGSGRILPMEFIVDGQVVETQLPSIVSVTGADLYTASALVGMGIVQVPRYRVLDELASGMLKVVLAAFPPPPMPVSVLYPQSRQLSSRVRVFAQWLRDIFEAAG